MPAHTAHHRPSRVRLALGAATMLALVLTGCSGSVETTSSGGITDPSASAASSSPASPSVSPTVTATPSQTGKTSGVNGVLPSAQLQQGPHEGEPRRLEDVFHVQCLHALDGTDLPESEDATPGEGEKPVWSVHRHQALTAGWKVCPTRMYEQIVVPTVFTVQAETDQGAGSISRLRIIDGAGQAVGGFQDDAAGGAPATTELVEAIEVTKLPQVPSSNGETRYLRTLVVDTSTGPQVLIDQVSAPADVDPASLKVWDLAAGGSRRVLVYASIHLEVTDDGPQVASSDQADVLRSMVCSFVPAVM
jgi:hypothetical protein